MIVPESITILPILGAVIFGDIAIADNIIIFAGTCKNYKNDVPSRNKL